MMSMTSGRMLSSSVAFGCSRVAPRPLLTARVPLTVTCSYGTTPKIGGGKKWKHQPVSPNGKPIKVKMHVKTGDTVQVRIGSALQGLGTKCGGVAHPILQPQPRRQPHTAAAHGGAGMVAAAHAQVTVQHGLDVGAALWTGHAWRSHTHRPHPRFSCIACTRRHMQVIAGKDKGVIGTITRVVTSNGKVVVEGVNIRTKHIAPRSQEETGQIKKQEYPIHHSNVMLYSKEKGVRSRVSHKVTEEGKKVRMEAWPCMGLAR